MSVGYSLRIRNLNQNADMSSLGVELGRFCIDRDISVKEVADEFGVTRTTVYNWFCGATTPQLTTEPFIQEYMDEMETGQF